MSFLFYCTNQIGFSEIGGLITKFFSLFFKGMPNSIVFYKGIFFHVIPVRIFRKTNISYPLIRTRTCPYQGVINFCFFGKFGALRFLETPVLRFALLPYYRRIGFIHIILQSAALKLCWTNEFSKSLSLP